MNILGHYEELWPEAAGTPQGSIKEFATTEREFDADRIRGYLDSGDVIASIMSVNRDLFDGESEILGGSSILTDGMWVWRQGLGYYFDHYNLRLPPEFFARVRQLNYQVPPVLDQRASEFTREIIKIL